LESGSPLNPDSPENKGGHSFLPALAPRSTEPVYTKNVNSAFIGTTLQRDLEVPPDSMQRKILSTPVFLTRFSS
jgi:hypothetical protein